MCIPVKNEELNLPKCLGSLVPYFDEIVIVDSKSTDRTRAIGQEFGAQVLDFDWNGSFPKKRNWALRTHTFRHPWVLFLDADECVTHAFIEEVTRVFGENSGEVGYWLHYDNWFMGRRLKHGDPMRKLALFKIGAGEYERFPEKSWSQLDMEVHEHPVLEGDVGEIRARLEHHDDRGIEHYISKHNAYSTWEANRYRWLRDADEEAWKTLNRRQRFKYRHLERWWFSGFYTFIAFCLKRGFLDGRSGWEFAKLKARYFNDVRLKTGEKRATVSDLEMDS